MKFNEAFYITGRGLVLTYKYEEGDIRKKMGDHIVYRDKVYLITGIEQFWKLCSPPKLGDDVGFTVRELSKL